MNVKTSPEFAALRSARWFAGKGREVTRAEPADEIALAGGRLVLLAIDYADGGTESYLHVNGPSGGEPAPGDGVWSALVETLVREGSVPGRLGRLELRPGPALESLLPGSVAAETIVSLDQSNTLVGLGSSLLVKAYRRLAQGVHPEVEVAAALAATGAPVPAFAGSVHYVQPDGGEIAVALLQELVAGAESGWEPPIVRLASTLAEGGDTAGYGEIGAVTAELHRALAGALGTGGAAPGSGARVLEESLAALAQAQRLDPAIGAVEPAARSALAPLAGLDGAPAQRIHGDLHVGQLLHAGGRVLVIDFEGDPLRDLAARRRPASPLRDVASLLRSIEHVGIAAERRAGGDAAPWARRARAAALAAYEAGAGTEVDRLVMRAFEVASDVATLVYAHRVVPEWAYAPRRSLERMLG